jgi:hypothetical protein
MNPQPQIDFVHDYLAWLKNRCSTEMRGAATVLHTPFLDAFNDGMAIHVDPRGPELILHDNGSTLENLDCMGLKIADSERRMRLIGHAIAGCAVRFEKGRLETTATVANLSQRIHFLLNAMSRLNDLWMSSVPHSSSDFFGMVQEFFDQQNVLYTANVSIPGRTVEHPMDFVIPLPRQQERLLKLVAAPSLQTAKVISFTWFEVMETRPASQRVVLLNDIRSGGLFSEDDEERKISEQAISILSSYSDKVFRWSDHEKPEFKKLWLPEAA